MNLKHIIKQVLLEDKSVTGDEAAASGARGAVASEKISRIMASMGVDLPGLDSLYSVGQLSVEPFKISFVLQKTLDNPDDLTLPETENFTGLAKVTDSSKNLTIEFKPFINGGLADYTFPIVFLQKEVYTNLPGTNKKIPALVEDKFYTVQFQNEFFEKIKDEEDEDLSIGDDESDEIKSIKDKIKSAKENPELIKQGMVQYVVKQLEKELEQLRSKKESLPIADNLILEENKSGFIVVEIHLSEIELGTKGKAKKRGDISSYGKKSGSCPPMCFNSTMKNDTNYPIVGRLKIVDAKDADVSRVKEIQNLFNVSGDNLEMKKSNRDKISIIVKEPKGNEFVMMKPKDNSQIDWTSGNPINVIVGHKALNYYGVNEFEAQVILKPRK